MPIAERLRHRHQTGIPVFESALDGSDQEVTAEASVQLEALVSLLTDALR